MRLKSLFVVVGSAAMLAASKPVYKEIAHSLGYDYVVASNAGVGASNGINDLIGILDQFKPIVHPEVASTIGTLDFFSGLISSLVGYVVKTWIRTFYTGSLLNDTPYIGELIRSADAMILPEYRQAVNSFVSASSTPAV
ncbi:hypothetical protein GGI10_004847 [Coemansia sp. RSA 2530]|uniref:Uncharacterized protein n=1 Tax=Coemansia linderi TaxID=2663919 RepID=A0ACC1KFP7_9FUNG|nr:hypothetical protein GGI10_004847 [Coemansia sp. RSA 2530]KAJ2789212.1 hypothetical protein GGI18_002532 [Coemansia linderi]